MAGAAPMAIVSAMHEELRALLPLLDAPQRVVRAGREFHRGQLHGRPVVLVLSGIGKVAAATTVAVLAGEFGPRSLLFTGVAGGLAAGVRVGDVVLARELLQHDMDASPLSVKFQLSFVEIQFGSLHPQQLEGGVIQLLIERHLAHSWIE